MSSRILPTFLFILIIGSFNLLLTSIIIQKKASILLFKPLITFEIKVNHVELIKHIEPSEPIVDAEFIEKN